MSLNNANQTIINIHALKIHIIKIINESQLDKWYKHTEKSRNKLQKYEYFLQLDY
jgi:hypothetical protein